MADASSPGRPRPPDHTPLPGLGEVWTWWIQLDVGDARATELARMLDPVERDRAARRSGASRTRFIAARAALRNVLGRCLGIEPGAVLFRYGDLGRPELDAPLDARGLRFNASHSGPLGLVAVVRDHRIGVDVERVRTVRNLERVADRVFSERERANLRALPAARLEAEFFQCWTRREAVIKALGTGIFRSLDRIEHPAPVPSATHREVTAVPPTARPDPVEEALAAGEWTLGSLIAPVEGFAAAFAVDRPALRVIDRTHGARGRSPEDAGGAR